MTTSEFRLDVGLWGINCDHHATPAYRFSPQGKAVALARYFREALGEEGKIKEAPRWAAQMLLGRRVTTLKRVREFEYLQLREALDEQTEDHPAAPYGPGEYR